MSILWTTPVMEMIDNKDLPRHVKKQMKEITIQTRQLLECTLGTIELAYLREEHHQRMKDEQTSKRNTDDE